MSQKEVENKIIANFQRDEGMMVLIYAQWCVNNGLDPKEIYSKAYPNQPENPLLAQMTDLTIPKEEAGEIADQTLLQILALFENDDLALVVHEEIEKRKHKR